MNLVPFKTPIYNEAEQNGSFIDEYTVLRESNFLLGKILMSIFAVVLVLFMPIQILFLVVALIVFLIPTVTRTIKID